MFVTTNAKFLKDDYVDSHELRSKVVIEEVQEARRASFKKMVEKEVVVSSTLPVTTSVSLVNTGVALITISMAPSTIALRRSERIIKALIDTREKPFWLNLIQLN